ncbi:MAG: dTDP-4-dehydrorhamnose 3,5-epimerase [Bacteroidota bacterium]
MVFNKTNIKEIIEINPMVFGDNRGYFFESYNQQLFLENGIDVEFVQDNQSFSHQGVLRGLHFQKPPFTQGKLVSVVQGAVMDIAVDLRGGSPTFGNHVSVVLSAEKQNMLWIPPGFAHGFLTLEDNTIFQYKCTKYYNKNSEATLLWNDSQLKIDWNIENPVISEKDKIGIPLKQLEIYFDYNDTY